MATRPAGLSHPAGAGDAARPAVAVSGLTRRFADRAVLDGLELQIAGGELVALLGRSGSGKSTLLRVLADLDREATGDRRVEGPVAVAFQDPRLLPWRRVADNVALGLRTDRPGAAARSALAEVGLEAKGDAWPETLSGGEAQRASLARALVREPRLLLLDEPFSALDALTRLSMHDLVLKLWTLHQPAILLVTHDVDEAITLADRVAVVRDGRIAFQAPVDSERPRAHDLPDIVALRRQLLQELGVRDDQAPPRSSRAGSTPSA